MAFVALTKEPELRTTWWISKTRPGGVSPFTMLNETNGLTVPNGLSYAWGRFSQILGKACTLPTKDDGNWYKNVKSYEKGKSPKLGALGVWTITSNGGTSFGVVEAISGDTIKVSAMSFGGPWQLRTATKNSKGEYTFDSNYVLQGFIYNPNVSEVNPVEEFLKVARGHQDVNPGTKLWVKKVTGYDSINKPWCCAFVWACAKTVKISGKCIPAQASSSELMKQGVEKLGGQFIDGPYYTRGAVIPEPGDIMGKHNMTESKRWRAVYKHYSMQHVGIVDHVNLKTRKLFTIEGNSSGKCRQRSYDFDDKTIGGYLRPNWAKVGGSVKAYVAQYNGDNNYQDSGSNQPINVYNSESTSEDATLRECCYITDNGQLSITDTSIKLSAINYTSGLMSILQATGGYSTGQTNLGVNYNPVGNNPSNSAQSADASKMKSANARTIFNYLTSTGMNIAQAIGFLGNIQHESGFKPSAVNKGSGASGICQWLGSRRRSMIARCGPDWKGNLSGQMAFIWTELKSTDKVTWKRLKNEVTSNTLEMAKKAAVIVCNEYERPFYKGMTAAAKERERTTRARYAEQLWKQLIITNNPTTVTASDRSGATGVDLQKGTRIDLPTQSQQSLNQSYFNYSYQYDKWKSNSSEKKVAQVWSNKGRKSIRKGIATIDGSLLIAVQPELGTVGDILTVVLSDGSKFNAIICKNTSYKTSKWGSVNRGRINVIEWAKIGDTKKISDTKELDLTGWKNKTITYVINYGTYLK